MLFDARCLFDGEEARADEVLRSIATDLPEAVATCAAAAAADHSPARQAALLKARPRYLIADRCFHYMIGDRYTAQHWTKPKGQTVSGCAFAFIGLVVRV